MFELEVPGNVIVVDPVGYEEMLVLMASSAGVITDSGTVVEETAVRRVPSVQMRRATERPQVYDCGSSVKFDRSSEDYPYATVVEKLESLRRKTWEHGLGDGRAPSASSPTSSNACTRPNGFRLHLPERYHIDISRSYREDGLDAAETGSVGRARAAELPGVCGHAGFVLGARPRRDATCRRFFAKRGRHRRRSAVPLAIHSCERCGLVQIVDLIDPDDPFSRTTPSPRARSPACRPLRGICAWLVDRFRPKVVEFGCNDGILLAPLEDRGVDAWG